MRLLNRPAPHPYEQAKRMERESHARLYGSYRPSIPVISWLLHEISPPSPKGSIARIYIREQK